MIKVLLVAAGGVAVYYFFQNRRLTGQSTNETVRVLQGQINSVQGQIYSAAVAVAIQESTTGRPPLFFHQIREDGVLGVETKGAMSTLKYFAQRVSPSLAEVWSLAALRSIDADQTSAGDMMLALDPLVEWSNNAGRPEATTLTIELGRIYLGVVES